MIKFLALSIAVLGSTVVLADPLSGFGFYGKPRLETIIEPCAADYSCVIFDGARIDLEPVSIKTNDYEIVAQKTTGPVTQFLIKTKLGVQPAMALVVRNVDTRRVKIVGIERGAPYANLALTDKQIADVAELTINPDFRTYLTTKDPLEMAKAAKAIIDGKPVGFRAIQVDVAQLSMNDAYHDAIPLKVERLQAALSNAIHRDCSNYPLTITYERLMRQCTYHRTMSSTKAIVNLQSILAADLLKQSGAR